MRARPPSFRAICPPGRRSSAADADIASRRRRWRRRAASIRSRYAPPAVFYLCHCATCQQQSASAFGQSVKVRAADVTIHGELAAFDADSAGGKPKLCEFCPKCGVRIAHGRRPGAETFNLKGGTFDDRGWLVPAGHIWTASKQPFVAIAADELQYPHQPPDYDALSAKWRAMIGV